jgi:hypothetical protein
MEKQASFIFTALGGHVLQNIAGAKLVKSKGFLEGTAKALLSGTLARNARKGTLKEGLKTAATSVAAPEAIMAQRRAYEAGRSLHTRARALGVDPNKLSKRDAAKLRMVAEGRLPDKQKTALTEKAKGMLGGNTLPPKTIKSGMIKEVLDRPVGKMGPHSSIATIGANTAATILEPGVGLMNAAKFGTESKVFQNSALGRYVEKNLVHKPLTSAFKSGAEGQAMSKLKSFGYTYGVNGAVGKAIEGAHKAGAKMTKAKV